ncbi:formate dehydrogenase iron-sulfur subunit [Micromonospora pattaloongensis]|uniref:Formate dehydrogenase iron-sulfur subunit n=1 Tax=Micromonospora pattaloongensis TaxID=405436 RepID=A0A1H3NWX8_9ACTN|nr:4Fe-4S dicluster domain-containing protein [Micromonospora pattaloongensis]SDY93015.1 formate dehydrogenase iron-sulfur subunit [Micromonospora pattaloongensis]
MVSAESLFGPIDPAPDAGYVDAPPRMGFFTDTSVCIGCKACEVACKEWNLVPDHGLDLLGMSYDNTGALTANSWRHVAFIEQPRPLGAESPALAGTATGPSGSAHLAERASTPPGVPNTDPGLPPAPHPGPAAAMAASPEFLGMPGTDLPGRQERAGQRTDLRWLMMSDVCKHCTHAACLDVCPTGSLFRTEFGTVVVQEDICNGCGYCISACPYGVIDQRKGDGRAWKCTLCYDRLRDNRVPACAQACPTESIQYGPLDELRERAQRRVERLHADGVPEARLYGHDENDGVGGDGAFFLLLDEPEVYGLPPDPIVTTRDLPDMWRRAGLAALAMAGAAVAAFVGRRSA